VRAHLVYLDEIASDGEFSNRVVFACRTEGTLAVYMQGKPVGRWQSDGAGGRMKYRVVEMEIEW